MNPRLRPMFASVARPWLVAWLLTAMLCAQWSGLHHRVEHAGLAQAVAPERAIAGLDQEPANHDDAHHSCVLFDGLTLADAGALSPPSLPLLPGTRVLALWTAYASWDAPPLCLFSPRAPPSI